MHRTDILSGLLLAFAGLLTIYVIIPTQISGHSDYGLAPDFFPRVLAWFFVILSVTLVGHRLFQLMTSKPATENDEPPMHVHDWLFIAGFAAFMVAIYALVDFAGFIVGGAIGIAVVSSLMGDLRKHPFRLATISLIVPVAVYYAFKKFFFVFLP
ncbi:tripartite tricarboxylate transporter TctB family protein [Oricola thermophila]|uniref:Tripartite tricarboxylate transporter TctB family protein n=1 Tax=Oricola thermophila TaxID=2742145 RepID=A0A6N1VL30_9HYPH|nr:tripartite tricarboxylate transporter TctB family protein [Oricola thermophila]QKV19667.1 tripartite tricarboxylate transporter TctB family protein [Oricola thermophila]